MAKRKAKQSKEEVLLAKKTRILKARHIAFICAEINSKRLPNGRLRRGEINKALKEHKTVSPWITIDLIKKGLKKDYAQPVATNIVSNISDLTGDTPNDVSPSTEEEPNDTPPFPPITIAAADASSSSKKVGRPRGTTVKAIKERSLKDEVLVNEITTEWAKIKQDGWRLTRL